MRKTADEAKGKTKARRKNPQPSRAADSTFPKGKTPSVAEPPVSAPTTAVSAAEISVPPTQILPSTSSIPAVNLDPLHMLKELAISLCSIGDPSVLFACLAEELIQEKASSSLTPLEIPPRTFTETTNPPTKQIPLPTPTENPKLLPPVQPPQSTSLPTAQIKLYLVEQKKEGKTEGGAEGAGEAEDKKKERECNNRALNGKMEKSGKQLHRPVAGRIGNPRGVRVLY